MFCILAVGTVEAAANIRVKVFVYTSQTVYTGEQFSFMILIDGSNKKPDKVDVSPLAIYNPQNPSQRQYSDIRPGKIVKQFAITYQLTAAKAGPLKLPSIDVTVAGKVYRTNTVDMEITEPGKTDKMDIQVDFSSTRCYVGQPLVMTVKWYIHANAIRSVKNYQFNVPALNSELFYLEDTPESLKNRTRRNSHTVNGQPITLFQRELKHNGVDSLKVFFDKILIPKKSGSIDIEPAAVTASFVDFYGKRTRFAEYSKPKKLQVLPLPTEGKSKDFYGLVGQYMIASWAGPTEVNIGDPITLKIRIGGSRYLKPVQMPDLMAIGAMAENFKVSIEKPSRQIEKGFKVFTQTIRANNDKVTEIPPIPLSYFDSSKGRYVTIETKPIKLKVAATHIVGPSDIEGNNYTAYSKSVELAKMGISAHFEGLEALQDEYFSPLAALVSPGYAFLWAGPLCILILSGLAKLLTHSTPEKITAGRRRSAFTNARKAAEKTIKHPSSEACQLLAAAMKQYAADKFGRIAKSLTAADCFDLIAKATSDTSTASEYKSILESCEASIYSPTEVKYEPALVKKVVAMMQAIEKETKR